MPCDVLLAPVSACKCPLLLLIADCVATILSHLGHNRRECRTQLPHIWSPADRLCLAKPSSSFSSFLCVMCTFNWSPGNGRWQALIELDCFFFFFFVSFLSLEGNRSEKRQLPVCANRGEGKDLIKRRLGVEFAPILPPFLLTLSAVLSSVTLLLLLLFPFHFLPLMQSTLFCFLFCLLFLSPSFSAIEANYRCWKVIESHWQHRRQQQQQQLGQKLIAWNCGCQKVAYNFFHFSFSDSRSILPIQFSYN